MKKYIYTILCIIICTFEINSQEIEITNSIAVGGVTSNSARFWIRTSIPAPVNIEVSEDQTYSGSIKGTENLIGKSIYSSTAIKPIQFPAKY